MAEKVLLNELSGVLAILSISHFRINAVLCRLIRKATLCFPGSELRPLETSVFPEK